FLPQIRRSKRWSWARAQLGAEYFLLGLLKKWVVADQLAQFADPVFADPGAFGTGANWLALLAFTLQVYCDISGYSDMALGTAHRLALTFFCVYQGFVLFRAPAFATATAMLHRLWVPAAGAGIVHPIGYGFFWSIVAGVVLCHVAAGCRWWEKVSLRLPAP